MRLRAGVAIDLGTVNTLVIVTGRGLVIEEPSAIAVDRATGRVAAVGMAADALAGKEPQDIEIIHPLRDGVIADLDASAAFYSELFGWKVADFEGMAERYMGIDNAGRHNGGMRALAPPTPPSWLVYFGVEDLDASLAKLDELGGMKLAGPIDITMAKLAVVADPQGAVFALYAGALEA